MQYSKINWLIHLKTLFKENEIRPVDEVIKVIENAQFQSQESSEEQFTVEDLIEEINRSGRQKVSYNDFFIIVGNMHSGELQQSTCVNSLIDSMISERQSNSQLSIRSNGKVSTLHWAQQQILEKISTIEQEIETKQKSFQKRNQQLFYRDHVNKEELYIQTFRGLSPIEIQQVLQQLVFTSVIVGEPCMQSIMALQTLKSIKYLSLNNLNLTHLELSLKLKVLSVRNNQLTYIDNIDTLEELYCQNNKITLIQPVTSLKIIDLSNNRVANLLCIAQNKQLQFLNCMGNPVQQSPDYKRLLYKTFHNLKAIDIDLKNHSQVESKEFHYDAPPLDFSFRNLAKLEDLKNMIPRGKKERKNDLNLKEKQQEQKSSEHEDVQQELKDSMMDDAQKTQNDDQLPPEGEQQQKKVEQKQSPDMLIPQNNYAGLLITQQNIPLNGKIIGGKLQENKNLNRDLRIKVQLNCSSLILSQNHLKSIVSLSTVIDGILPNLKNLIIDNVAYDRSYIRWIDLSYNELTDIDYDFRDFPQLQSLYLHCNHLRNLADIGKLQHLAHLRSITLHGNDFAGEKGSYRLRVVQLLPQLTRVDSVLVSKKVKQIPQLRKEIMLRSIYVQFRKRWCVNDIKIMSTYKYLFKFIVIGDVSVGKSCLVLQFTEGRSLKEHETTIGVEFGVKELIVRGQPVKISIWDTAGQESFRSLVRSYYRSAIGILLVYDMTRADSFHDLQKWLEEIRENSNENVVITVVCNKIDLEDQRQVSSQDGKNFAESNGFLYVETSALQGTRVTEAFRMTAETVDAKITDGTIKLGRHVQILISQQMGVTVGSLYNSDAQQLSIGNKQQIKESNKKDCC